jgi:hypothetical protein
VTHRTGERYTEQQLVEILRRAADRQEGLASEPDGRFSLEEIQQIASDVGISPAYVADAAAELDSPAPVPRTGVLGAPTVFRFERWLDGEIPRDGIGELFDIARRETELQGTVTEALDTVEWWGRGHMGSTTVSVARRRGRTQISVAIARSEAAALVASTSSVAGVIGAVAIGSSLAVAGAGAAALAAVAVVSVSWGGAGSLVAMRGIWRRAARKWGPRAQALGVQLVAAAQRAIEAARKDSE